MAAPASFRIPLSRPDVRAEDRATVDQVLRGDWLSRGPAQADFEAAMATYLDCPNAVAVSSGTAALTLTLQALNIGPGDQVITSPFTVPATLNAIAQSGAEPVLVDIDAEHLALDPALLGDVITPSCRALMPVHPFGLAAQMSELLEIGDRHGLPLIEDSCEALGTRIDGQALGTLGKAGAFGFYPNKQLTTGEGGLIVTRDEQLATRVRRLANHGRGENRNEDRQKPRWLDQQEVGSNARLSDIACALGRSQLSRIEQVIERRAQIMDHYQRRLGDSRMLRIPGLAGARSNAQVRVSWFACPVVLDAAFSCADRDWVVDQMATAGIQCGRYFAPMHRQPAWRTQFADADFPVCDAISERMLILPLFNQLQPDEVGEVCDHLLSLLAQRSGPTNLL